MNSSIPHLSTAHLFCARRTTWRFATSCIISIVVLLALAVSLTSTAAAGTTEGFRVIVRLDNPRNDANNEILADLFLKRRTEWPNGEAARPVDLKADSDVRAQFSKSVLQRSVAAVKSYWQQVIFSGRGVPPPELDSDAAVVDYVANHPGAVGYVSINAVIGRVKEITIH